jgi:hypothetical protein
LGSHSFPGFLTVGSLLTMPLTFFPAKKVSKKALRALEQLATASARVFLPSPLKMQNSFHSNSCIFFTREGKKNPAVQSPEPIHKVSYLFGLISAEPKLAGL